MNLLSILLDSVLGLNLSPRMMVFAVVLFIAIYYIIKAILWFSNRLRDMYERCEAVNKKPSLKNFFTLPEFYDVVTTSQRGTEGERELISVMIESGIKSTAIYHDLLVPQPNGATSQVDIVVMTKVGLVVVEVKDHGGLIYGNGKQSRWTSVYNPSAKYQFYNPFMQNETHIRVLKQQLGSTIPMYSLVVFTRAKIKDVSLIPSESYLATKDGFMQALKTIEQSHQVYNYGDAWSIATKLKQMSDNGGKQDLQSRHVETVIDYTGQNRVFR